MQVKKYKEILSIDEDTKTSGEHILKIGTKNLYSNHKVEKVGISSMVWEKDYDSILEALDKHKVNELLLGDNSTALMGTLSMLLNNGWEIDKTDRINEYDFREEVVGEKMVLVMKRKEEFQTPFETITSLSGEMTVGEKTLKNGALTLKEFYKLNQVGIMESVWNHEYDSLFKALDKHEIKEFILGDNSTAFKDTLVQLINNGWKIKEATEKHKYVGDEVSETISVVVMERQ